jgi:segregation and condensation protein A
MTLITLDQFSGPFSLLINLIDDEKLSISDLSLSQVTEQYLAYLEGLEEKKAEELSDFLVVASRLLLLKARLLLPQLMPDEEEGPDLAEQLRLYKMFVKASRHIDTLWNTTAISYGRVESIRKATEFVVPQNMTKKYLLDSMWYLIKRIRPAKPIPEMSIDKAVSLRETITKFKNLFKKMSALSFDDCITEKGNKTEILVSFLAILELVKQNVISLRQSNNFDTIHIQKT